MVDKLIIAGGGTGGHIFPGIAIAQEWKNRGGEVLFIGTPAGQEGKLVPQHGFDIRLLKVGRLKGGGLVQKMKTLLGLPFSIFQAMKIIKNERPVAVFGIGGYASGPAMLAGKLLGKMTAITDQNVHPGFTNRVLGKFVRRIYLSFAESEEFFPKEKTRLVGNPTRSQMEYTPYEIARDDFNLLVFGGSQGAVTMNKKFILALDQMKSLWPKLKVYHQSGATDFESLTEFYKSRGIRAEVSKFFDDISGLYHKAHFVVCRAGAGTLTELALCGRPALLVPYPFAADDHQTANANVFVNQNAAWMMKQSEIDEKALADFMTDLIENPEKLKQCAENARKLAHPNAAKELVTDLMSQLKSA